MAKYIIYIILIVIGFVLIAFASISNWDDYIKIIATTPGLAAVSGVLFQLLRDTMTHERQLIVRYREELFETGCASHMAKVTFDKHVTFCEEYTNKASEILRALWAEGPSSMCLGYSQELNDIRVKHVLWITPDTAKQLRQFESVLAKIGADSFILTDIPVGDKRSAVTQKMYENWADLIGEKKFGAERVIDEQSVLDMIAWLQGVLGIMELTTLRKSILTGTFDRIKS